MNNAVLAIVATEAKQAAQKETTLEGRLRAAMNAVKDHWMVTDDDVRFQGAVAGAHMLSDDSDKKRIEFELRFLRTMSAASSGVPVNLGALLEEAGEDYEPIGLTKLWHEAKKA